MVVSRALKNRWLPPLFWMAAIFFMSNQPKSAIVQLGMWDLLVKKGAHLTAYALLAWLLLRAMRGWRRPYLYAFLFTLAYAVSDEFHQTFVPGRNGAAVDVVIDGLGGLLMLAVGRWRDRSSPFRWPLKSRWGQKATTDAP